MHEPTAAIPGVDLDRLTAWLRESGTSDAPVEDVRAVGGGTQNIMVAFRSGALDVVLRRGPLHPRERTNEALRREMRLLRALAPTPVPHPRVVAACEDPDVLGGSVFYLAERVEGRNPVLGLPDGVADDAAARHAMGISMVDALATLALVDHEAVGLGDFGRPAGFLERQVPRWRGELARYAELTGDADHGLPGVEELAAWLERHRPATFAPGVMHGDYHLANVMFRTDAPAVAAIVDWEMATIGDPLLDLGWMLVTWPEPGRPALIAGELATLGGLPDRRELAGRYAERTGRDLADLDWYVALAGFKLAVILEGTCARARAGKADASIGAQLHDAAVEILDRAASVVAR